MNGREADMQESNTDKAEDDANVKKHVHLVTVLVCIVTGIWFLQTNGEVLLCKNYIKLKNILMCRSS